LYYACFKQFKIPPAPSDRHSDCHHDQVDKSSDDGKVSDFGWRERMQMTLGLWRWGVPLIVVYFAEYAMQSGTWTAIGFPVNDCDARKRFYQYAGFCYQAGVLISRSSGTGGSRKKREGQQEPKPSICLYLLLSNFPISFIFTLSPQCGGPPSLPSG
jgi:hypothetical protein